MTPAYEIAKARYAAARAALDQAAREGDWDRVRELARPSAQAANAASAAHDEETGADVTGGTA